MSSNLSSGMSFSTLEQELEELKRQGLYRCCRTVEEIQGGRIRIGGRWLLHLASNSYLGLHQHPAVLQAAREALGRYGAGAGSARLMAGTFSLHEALEEALARFKGTEAALVFPSGYAANLGILPSLVGRQDLIVSDRLNHASLLDAARLSGATLRVYPHRDTARLEEVLKRRRAGFRRALVVTEGVFSMDGDVAPLAQVAQIARRHGAWILLDDAHGTGVMGPGGRGTLEHFGMMADETLLQMGTLSKALGSQGGFLAGPRLLVNYLKNKARSFIYTTALAPASVAAALEAVRVIEREPLWRQRLWENSRRWVAGLQGVGYELISEETPIVPIRVGETAEAVALADRLLKAGVYAPAIRPPTVPAGEARLRTSLTALHTPEDLEVALEAFRAVRHAVV